MCVSAPACDTHMHSCLQAGTVMHFLGTAVYIFLLLTFNF